MTEMVTPGSVILAIILVLLYRQFTGNHLPLPPGPKPRFITGNVHQLPRSLPWLTYASWSKIYGPLVYFRMFNTKILVLNSAKPALDLLENRSVIYSDRPTSWMMGELAGRSLSVFMVPFQNPRFKVYRRMLHSGLNPRAIQDYKPIQLQETRTLLNSLLRAPKDFVAHIRRNAGALILKVSYGYQVESNDDEFVRIVEEGFQLFASSTVPGMFYVEAVPILRFVPEWVPGAGFKRWAKEVSKALSRIDNVPFNWAKKNIATGDYVESFTSKHLEENIEEEDIIKWCSAALYAGGADTTVAALTNFFMLMALHPDMQKKAQQHIEETIGDRLPVPEDYTSMPYISALMKEVMRWGTVVPLGLRHRVMEDDIYDGYFIPKGTTVIGNIWAITHDPELYPDPGVFDPSRHLGEQPQFDPFKFVFGFGRRVCPGAHFAEVSLFLNIASILATFNITKAQDPDGKEIEPAIEWTTGVVSHVKPFECRITPRNEALEF